MIFPDYPVPDSGTIPYSSKHTTSDLHILIDFFLFNATTLYLIINAKFQIILASTKQCPYFKIVNLDFDSSPYIRCNFTRTLQILLLPAILLPAHDYMYPV